jgi:MFS family permease
VFRDLPGIGLFAAAGVLSLLWLSLAGHRFAWSSPTSLSLMAGTGVLWLLLALQERRAASPFLPVELLGIRGIPTAAVAVLFSSACLFSMTVFLPVYMQLGLKFDAARAGLALLPLTCAMPLGGMAAGRIVTRTGHLRGLTAVGMGIAAIAFLALGFAPATLESVLVLGFFCGLGLGTVMPMTQVTVQTLAGRERLGVAAALVSLARTTGGALGTAASGALLFAFMHGVDLRSLTTIVEAERPAIIEAFRHTFFALAGLAGIGAWIASRVPALRF